MAMNLQPSQSNSAVRKTPKGLVKGYCQDLMALGFGDQTKNRNGLRLPISEETFNNLEVANAEDEGTKTGIFKSEFVTDEGFVGHSLFVMYRANPKQVKDLLEGMGFPSPKDAHKQIQEVEDEYPDYWVFSLTFF